MQQPKALAFDIFGTTVDWRSGIVEAGRRLGDRKGIRADWGAFADSWRAGYGPAMDRIRRGELPWTNLDQLHRTILDDVLTRFGISCLDDEDKGGLNLAWHRLKAWPDAVEGLKRLRKRCTVVALSNGNTALLIDIAKNARLPFDCIIGADMVRRYKPEPELYRTGAALLALPPDQVMMVASHKFDLRGAAAVGFSTAFVSRKLEAGLPGSPEGSPDRKPENAFDVVVNDFIELAEALGA